MNRAYRITFDHTVSKFVIEIQGFLGLYWKPAQLDGNEVQYFSTFGEASDYVKKIGLDKVYQDFTGQKPYGAPDKDLAYYKPIQPQPNVFWVADNQPYPTINKERA